jgi:hypothetical protein
MMHHHKRQAGVDAASFDPRRARAALAAIATRLRAGQRDVFRQSVEQRRAGFRVSE